MPQLPDDPANLAEDQRRREIAAILARGILLLHCMRQFAPAAGPAGDPTESVESSLEASAPSRPDVTGS